MLKKIALTTLAFSLFAALSPAIAGPVLAKPNTTPPQVRLPLLDGQHLFNDTFTRVDTVNVLPPSVLNELMVPQEKLKQWAGGKLSQAEIADLVIRGSMANPGQPFEMSDMVSPKPLPFHRLVFAGVSAGYCFVYNEYGGLIEGTEVSLYRLPTPGHAAPGQPPHLGQNAAGRATLVWQASLQDDKTFLNWEQLRQAIIQGRYYTRYVSPAPPSPVLAK